MAYDTTLGELFRDHPGRPTWPFPGFDGRAWAREFCAQYGITHDGAPVEDAEGLMIAWFASALMRGYAEARSTTPTQI